MFELNPLNLPDAMWQHMIMLVVAAIIGYVIGYRSSRGVAESLEVELANLDVELSNCHDRIATMVVVPPIAPVIDPINAIDLLSFVAPEPIDLVATTLPATVADVTDPMEMVPVQPDNLKLVEGIGPKIEELLNKEGILTFRHLSEATNERLVDILRAAGPRFQMHDPESWPQQAEMAASGRWDEFKTRQDIMNKGRLA